MRIAVVSTPFVPVPPIGYGGTERVVDELVTGLIAAGEDVTLFTCGRPPAKRHARLVVRVLYQRPVWPPTPHAELTHATWALEEVSRGNFDLVHVHVPAAAGLASKLQVPLLCTVHHAQLDAYDTLYARAQVSLVAISASQRRLSPAIARATVIHHGLSPHAHPFGSGQGGYAAFLGRLSSEKGVHLAIDIADRAGVPLKIAGRPHWEDQDYYARLVEPRLYRARSRSRAVGELDGKRKVGLLAGAMALLFPIQWDEPFGLVMIEAMLSGTPVIALARGAVPEVIEDGVTGFVCRDPDEMAGRLQTISAHGFDRKRCRAAALARFSSARMVADHLHLYDALTGWEADERRTAQATPCP